MRVSIHLSNLPKAKVPPVRELVRAIPRSDLPFKMISLAAVLTTVCRAASRRPGSQNSLGKACGGSDKDGAGKRVRSQDTF